MAQQTGKYSWWTDTRSANPTPTCRKGGCPDLAAEGQDWCPGHAVVVRLDQEHAQERFARLRSERRSSGALRREGRG